MDTILDEDMSWLGLGRQFYWCGFDKGGRPCLVFRACEHRRAESDADVSPELKVVEKLVSEWINNLLPYERETFGFTVLSLKSVLSDHGVYAFFCASSSVCRCVQIVFQLKRKRISIILKRNCRQIV